MSFVWGDQPERLARLGEGIAAVKVTSSMFYDYLLVAEIDGRWKISNVVWEMSDEWMERMPWGGSTAISLRARGRKESKGNLLHRLEKQGLITGEWRIDDKGKARGKPKRVYQITEVGLGVARSPMEHPAKGA